MEADSSFSVFPFFVKSAVSQVPVGYLALFRTIVAACGGRVPVMATVAVKGNRRKHWSLFTMLFPSVTENFFGLYKIQSNFM